MASGNRPRSKTDHAGDRARRRERNHSPVPGVPQIACKGAFDGKDYPLTGAGATLKQTLAFEKTGSNSIKLTTKINGTDATSEVLTLSADGKTLTDEANPVAVKEPSKAVYNGNNRC